MYDDYKRNGTYWTFYASNVSEIWYASIGHELALKNIEWANNDIAEGFANYYRTLAYFQKHIPQLWINQIALDKCSMLDLMMSYIVQDDKIVHLSQLENDIPRDEFKNIYFPRESFTEDEGYRETFYDKRMDDLVVKIVESGSSLSDEALKLRIENKIKTDKEWRNIEIDDFPIGQDYFINDYRGNEPYGFEGFKSMNGDHQFKQLCITLADKYLEGFEFREDISTKKQWVFSKYINEKYQWILLFNVIMSVADGLAPQFLLCKHTIKRNVKPKDVVFQHDFFARHGNGVLNSIFHERALYSQYFYYVNRSLERFIEWMQPRLLEVVDAF